ncbi:beta-galactosidase family protein [Microbacterium sp. SORGH_AS_0888]|uniref:glycoside hydrolase family 35 protein n=1 Tax=Microbacterium sp. SORGH_AS_0888 TaxID=3041791 RepID=UPI002785013D|nr:beta-galactosidase family protein [Microbacterium sp. SORGH_AS_0888]MDQ1130353.1 beta-galactosidase [Microbacterium sp. SORGH_AS_0888]
MAHGTFHIGESDFLLDGRPFRVLAGALHYFRVHPDQWRDRIRAARLMGLNTIETYVPWNEHEPTQGEFSAEGRLDLARFLDLVAEEGMRAIVRPGPYICAEWDGGGLPAWLFRDGASGVRTADPRFLDPVSAFLRRVLEIVVPRQIERGGPVVLMQVENEYGAYGDIPRPERERYLRALVEIYRGAGVTVPLVTVDQPTDEMLAQGSLPELHRTGSFGGQVADRLRTLRAHQPTGPLMCSEFWCGWFDYWGSFHRTTALAPAVEALDALLAAGASVNVYMFHGGTNFALTNGTNDKGVFEPTVTSYDYGAPLDEAGRPTEKFWAFREVISRYAEVPEIADGDLLAPLAAAPADVPLVPVAALDDLLDPLAATDTARVPTMDELGMARGFVRHTTRLAAGSEPVVLDVGEVRDRAWVSLDGRPVGVLSRDRREHTLVLPSGEGELRILVEDQGRVNYGFRIGEHKGLLGPVTVDGGEVTGWRSVVVPWEDLPARISDRADAASRPVAGATVLRARVELDAPRDLVIDTTDLGKGLVWFGDACLGRFWRTGPQHSLFVPAPLTRAGENLLTVLDLEPTGAQRLRFADTLLLGPIEY